MTPSVPWRGDRHRDKDRTEKAAGVGVQTLPESMHCHAFSSLDEEKSN